MRFLFLALFLSAVTTGALAGEVQTYKYVDENGNPVFGDRVPPEAAERDKVVLNEHAIAVDKIRGRKSAEELEQERLEEELRIARQEEQRRDRALTGTYLSVDEIIMHRDRRVELFQAQARVTEMFLGNLERRLGKLESEASRYQPFSDDPDAPMVDPDLVDEMQLTRETIERHRDNLGKFRRDEKAIIERFDRDIRRFKELKGITANSR